MYVCFGKLTWRSPAGHDSDRRLNRIVLADRSSKLQFLIDTGADISVIPKTKIASSQVQNNLMLYAANGTKIQTFGTKLIKLDLNLRRVFAWSFVIADVNQPIIGIDFLKHFNLLVDVRNNCLIHAQAKISSRGQLPSICPSNTNISILLGTSEFDKLLGSYPELINPSQIVHNKQTPEVFHFIETSRPTVFSKPCRLSPELQK